MQNSNRADYFYPSAMNYLDGVPVKIGERFKPPRRVVLPLNFQCRNPNDILKEEYNFNLEKQVLEWSEKYRKTKEDKARAKEEQVGNQIEQFTRHRPTTPSASSDESPSGSSTLPSSSGDSSNGVVVTEISRSEKLGEPLPPPINCAILANLDTNDILKPVPMDLPSSGSACKPSSSEGQSTANIKLEDFEAESSPFDSVELKTLNDIEELKSVLQGMTAPGHGMKAQSYHTAEPAAERGVTMHSKPTVNGVAYYYPEGPTSVNGIVTNIHGFPTALTGSSFLPSVPTNPHVSFVNLDKDRAIYKCMTNSVSWVSPTTPAITPFYSQANTNGDRVSCSSSATDFGNLTSTYFSAESQPPLHPGSVTTPGSDSSSSSGGSLRNARSTPDLLRELGRAQTKVDMHGSHLHPPRPNSVGPIEDASSIYHIEELQKRMMEKLMISMSELSTEDKILIDRMVDMGFPRERAAHAVKYLGNDDKKVVEHLCAVQSLTEKGFTPDKCTMALFLHEEDEIMAEDYLRLMQQFLDLGFEETAIKRALYLTKNNRDKALDYLVS